MRFFAGELEPSTNNNYDFNTMSYTEHFRLKEQPFRLTPDPDFVYWSEQHARAKSYLESTIWLADGFVILTGDIGSGKTTLLQTFLSELQDDVTYALISQTQLSPEEFLQSILAEFGFRPFDKGKAELLDMFNTFLMEEYQAGRRVLLIVDEAQNLSRRVLEEIRLLSGLETHKEKVLRIIIAGQPELRDKISREDLRQLTQRVRLRFHLGPLTKVEQREYIEHRLAIAGATDRQIFEPETFDRIYEFTDGVPRLTNTLCDTAMLCAFAEEKDTVGPEEIEAALEELNWTVPPARSHTGEYPLARLELREDDNSIEYFDLEPGRMIIGRTKDNDIQIHSKFVSRHHAQIVTESGISVIEDLNSTNGMFIGGRQIKKRRLQDGDIIALGRHQLVYTDLRAQDEVNEQSAIREIPHIGPLDESENADVAPMDDSAAEQQPRADIEQYGN